MIDDELGDLLAKDFTVRIVEIASSANEFESAKASWTFVCCFYATQEQFSNVTQCMDTYGYKISVDFSGAEG